MMKTIIYIISLAAMAVANTELEEILQKSNDQFTANMFSEVVKSKPEESVVISGFSVMPILIQIGLATVNETHDEILRTAGFPNYNVAKEVFSDVNKRLRSVTDIELKLANRIYVKNGAELNDQFATVSKDVFGSDVKSVDFVKAVETAGEINAWVEDNTNHRIKNLISPDSLGPQTAVVLVNAIYFKGKWKTPFNEEATTERDFHVTKNKTIKVPMMSQTHDFKYGESKELDAKLLEMPYEGEQSSLLIVLPNKDDGINSLVEKMKKPSVLAYAQNNMRIYEVDVSIPKFKIETTTDLKDVLMKMGSTRLFTVGEAKLDNLLKGQNDLVVSDAIQKAFIEVNEEGAEAAAANQYDLPNKIFTPGFELIADRPFYFQVKYGDIELFSGTLMKPSY